MNILCILFLIIGVSLQAYNTDKDTRSQLWKRAHIVYKKGATLDALALYEMITPKTSAVWFNMGICHAVLKNNNQAIVCWNRARKGATCRQLKRIDESLDTLMPNHSHSFLVRIVRLYNYLQQSISLLLMQLIALCLWYTFIMLGYMTHKRRRRVLRLVCGTLIIFCMGGLLIRYSNSVPQAMVIHDNAPLYAGPCQDYHAIGAIKIGTLVRIKKEQHEWVKIKVGKKNGWVRINDVCMV